MIITIYSSKGGAGKTPIATNIILDREYAVGCNELENVYNYFLPKDKIISIDLSNSFPVINKPHREPIDIIFDLGGSVSRTSHSITSAINQSDLVIVPIEDEFKSMNKGLETLREIHALKSFNGSILVIATKLEKCKKEFFKHDQWEQSLAFQNIKNAVEGHGFKVPVLPLKFSKVFNTIFEREMSIKQLRASDPLANYNYRDVSAQFDQIYNAIDFIEGKDNAKQEQSREHQATA